ATSPEPTPRSRTVPSPIRASRSRASRISCCSARVASPSARASHSRAASLCCHTAQQRYLGAVPAHRVSTSDRRSDRAPGALRRRGRRVGRPLGLRLAARGRRANTRGDFLLGHVPPPLLYVLEVALPLQRDLERLHAARKAGVVVQESDEVLPPLIVF